MIDSALFPGQHDPATKSRSIQDPEIERFQILGAPQNETTLLFGRIIASPSDRLTAVEHYNRCIEFVYGNGAGDFVEPIHALVDTYRLVTAADFCIGSWAVALTAGSHDGGHTFLDAADGIYSGLITSRQDLATLYPPNTSVHDTFRRLPASSTGF